MKTYPTFFSHDVHKEDAVESISGGVKSLREFSKGQWRMAKWKRQLSQFFYFMLVRTPQVRKYFVVSVWKVAHLDLIQYILPSSFPSPFLPFLLFHFSLLLTNHCVFQPSRQTLSTQMATPTERLKVCDHRIWIAVYLFVLCCLAFVVRCFLWLCCCLVVDTE